MLYTPSRHHGVPFLCAYGKPSPARGNRGALSVALGVDAQYLMEILCFVQGYDNVAWEKDDRCERRVIRAKSHVVWSLELERDTVLWWWYELVGNVKVTIPIKRTFLRLCLHELSKPCTFSLQHWNGICMVSISSSPLDLLCSDNHSPEIQLLLGPPIALSVLGPLCSTIISIPSSLCS